MKKISLLVSLLFLLPGCGSDVTPIIGCEEANGIKLVCNMQNPEDLARIGRSAFLVVSQFGAMDGTRPGNIVLFNTIDNSLDVVFPDEKIVQPEPGWGEQNCTAPPAESFSPHGIDLATINGRQRLLVVNHGGRESIEFFEIIEEQLPRFIWRGCVHAQDDQFFNDVVNLKEGGFLATHMMPKSEQLSSNLKGLFGQDTGYVVEWNLDAGFKKVAGTDSPFPNGIEISDDESAIYVNIYMAGEVRKISRSDGRLLGTAMVPGPDNITWADSGNLLVASHVDGLLELMACNGLEEGNCGFGFEIVAVNPETMSRQILFSHRGAPMGGVTVALTVDERIYLGTFAGDRMGIIEKP